MQKKVLPGHENQNEILCPSCGQFVGALTKCPNCGARVTKRMSIRVVRMAALALAIGGLGLLYLMALNREIPVVKIGEIRPTMNFAYVRLAGEVNGDARIFKQGGHIRSLTFYVDDGTGEIPVTAYRGQAEDLVATGSIPRSGDKVEVAGSLSVSSDDNIALRLQVPDQLSLARSELSVTRLADVTTGMRGESIAIEGAIASVASPNPGTKMPWSLAVDDGTAVLAMTFWADTYEEFPDKALLAPGSHIRARVGVSDYKGALQLKLGSALDLEFPVVDAARSMTAGPAVPSPRPAAVALKDITSTMAGQTIVVEARVESVREGDPTTKAPTEVVLRQDDASLRVVYWDKVSYFLKDNKPKPGALIRVEGMIAVYQEKVQLKVNRADRIEIVEAPPAGFVPVPMAPVAAPVTSVAQPAVVPAAVPVVEHAEVPNIAGITFALVRKSCTVTGTLGVPEAIKNGMKITITDASGSIPMIVWDRTMQGAERNALQAGAKAKVTGVIVDYKGTIEIVPENAGGIAILP